MTFPGFASSGGGAPGVGFGGGVAFVGVGFAGGNARRVVAAVDDDAAILAEADEFETRDESDESDSTLADSSNSTLDSGLGLGSDADWRANGSALGARAVRFAVDAWTSSGRPAPERVVVHHEGVSPPEFAAAAEATALAMGASRADVVDVSREKSGAGGSGVVTGRALRWDRERGVRAAERGSFWLDGEDAALAVTAGEVEKANAADAEKANANRAADSRRGRSRFAGGGAGRICTSSRGRWWCSPRWASPDSAARTRSRSRSEVEDEGEDPPSSSCDVVYEREGIMSRARNVRQT